MTSSLVSVVPCLPRRGGCAPNIGKGNVIACQGREEIAVPAWSGRVRLLHSSGGAWVSSTALCVQPRRPGWPYGTTAARIDNSGRTPRAEAISKSESADWVRQQPRAWYASRSVTVEGGSEFAPAPGKAERPQDSAISAKLDGIREHWPFLRPRFTI